MALSVIEVLGVPQVSPYDGMADQIKIHFLKRRNSGGDVLMVIYPTSTPGQAYVVFESDKVPGVLERPHILDVNNRFYPIRVKEADLSEVDMPVETTLHLSVFPNRDSVLKLLECYDFTIAEDIPGRLQLKGSFLKLKLVRTQLIRLLCHHHHRFRPSSDLPNGVSSGYQLERESNSRDADGPQQLLVSTTSSSSYRRSGSSGSPNIPQSLHSFSGGRNGSIRVDAVAEEHQDRNRPVLAHGWRSRADGASSDLSGVNLPARYSGSASTRGTSRATDTVHTSHEDSDSDGSQSRLSSDASPSSSSGGDSSFHVATDIINFIQTQHEDLVKIFRKKYGTKMVVQADADVATVTLSGKNSKKAEACLLNLIREISPLLRTQEIHLKNYHPTTQRQILERVERNRDRRVMITQRDDVIKLVGTSIESFEMKQVIVGHNDDLSRGRSMEKESKGRRSSSLPRLYKTTPNLPSKNPEPQASGPIEYNPSRYQEKPDERKSPQIGPDSERKGSKLMEQRLHQDAELLPTSPGKMSTKLKSLKKRVNSGLQILPIKKKDFPLQKQTQD